MRFLFCAFFVLGSVTPALEAGGDWDFFAEPVAMAEPDPEPVGLPVVYYFTRSDCPPCAKLKREIKAITTCNFIESETPDWVKAFPSLMWEDARGNWATFEGWDKEAFLKKYKETTRKKTATATVSSGYPLRPRGARVWNVDGYNNPSKSYVINHLMAAPDHAGEFSRERLEGLTVAELRALHSDDHDGIVKTQYLNGEQPDRERPPENAPAPAVTGGGYYYTNKRGRVKFSRPRFFSGGGCPGGNCPR